MRIRSATIKSVLLALAACTPTDRGAVAADQSGPANAVGSGGNALSTVAASTTAGAKPVIRVWKSPTCECCAGWVEHLKAAGYPVQVEQVADVDAIKRARGIPGRLTSCHTALVEGYLIEGHVPADVIDRVLAERPAVAGVAVPGMVVGSPGMEVPGQEPERYDIVAFKANGESEVYDRR